MIKYALTAALLLSFTDGEALLADDISQIKVVASRVANTSPASGYATAATALRFDPLTELQSRGIAEGQSDVTVRGGLFESTGFKLGAVTVVDPQTGHYVAGLPVDPALMSVPTVHTGIDSAIDGFNATIATVSYRLNRIVEGGSAMLGSGSDSLNFQSLRFALTTTNVSANDIGVAVSLARSEGEGSVANGDHEFARANLQIQHATDDSQTDLLIGYQDKFFGWPGAYTGFASLPEIDDTQTTLLLVNHRRQLDKGWLEVGGFYRRLVDDYDFDRTTLESAAAGSFEHETKVIGLGFQGSQRSGRIAWRYGAQITADKLVRSTDLSSGLFTDRTYATFSIVPSFDTSLGSGNILSWRIGASVDYSNRESSAVSPLLGVTMSRTDALGTSEVSIEYAATSKVPGYTALNSNPSGLFGGNALLGREKARQLSASFMRETADWQFRATLFARRDDELVDWTYAIGVPFARQANAVDIDVRGFEAFVVREWEFVDIAFGYTTLNKDEDYGSAQVDASFYALNFARHRATLAFTARLPRGIEIRIDNEYRRQQHNPLRVGDDSAYLASASLRWRSAGERHFGAALIVDNATDSQYQPFPGTPASGRQVSLNASYTW